jgi:hypothetical protein
MIEGGQRIAQPYSTFCPKLLAGIDNGAMPDTIADRCIRIVLKRKKAGQEVERFMYRKVAPVAEELKARISQWSKNELEALYEAEPTLIEELSDRAFEIAEPLLAIADRMPGWHDRGREALTFLLRGETAALSAQAQALQHARDYMENHGEDRIRSAVLTELCGLTVDRSGTRKLANMLRPYGIEPSTYRFNGKPDKGYLRTDFEDAWERYL